MRSWHMLSHGICCPKSKSGQVEFQAESYYEFSTSPFDRADRKYPCSLSYKDMSQSSVDETNRQSTGQKYIGGNTAQY